MLTHCAGPARRLEARSAVGRHPSCSHCYSKAASVAMLKHKPGCMAGVHTNVRACGMLPSQSARPPSLAYGAQGRQSRAGPSLAERGILCKSTALRPRRCSSGQHRPSWVRAAGAPGTAIFYLVEVLAYQHRTFAGDNEVDVADRIIAGLCYIVVRADATAISWPSEVIQC